MTPREAAHYRVLRLIEEQPEISQRELARVLGVSLGKTHYLLTPSGIAAKLELTRAFLRLKEGEYRAAHEEIERLRRELDVTAPPVESAVASVDSEVAARKTG